MKRFLAGLLARLRGPNREGPEQGGDLDRLLRTIRFEPRASLGPELYARARRGEGAPVIGRSGRGRPLAWGAAGVAVMGVLIWHLASGGSDREASRLDRCCFDLDGGNHADDGFVIVAGAGETVFSLFLYEDRDGSRGFTPADVARFAPAGGRQAGGTLGLVTLDHCCWDLDAGGRDDDGIMVVSAPPDRVLLAAIYEARESPGAASRGALLRYVLH
ncbi:MAG: hypothetical protein ACREMF_01520 [Gemmatimonadales bacterium]